MATSTETLDALKSIGLNLYERKIYVSLLAKGVATAAELSELANVPRSRSYDVLETLAEKGFVVIQPSKPIKYVALEPKEALEQVKEITKKKNEEMIERIDKLLESPVVEELSGIHTQGIDLMEPADMTGTLKGRHIINRQLASLFRDAKGKIHIATTEQGLNDLYSKHFRLLKKSARRGAKIKILAPLNNNTAVNAFSEIAELRNIENPIGRFCIVDDKHLVMALTGDDDVHETQDVAFWAKSSHAAKNTIRPYFEHLWASKKPQ